MHTRSGLVSCAFMLIACASNPDPRRRSVEVAQRDGHGGWVIVERASGPSITGELIAVAPDAISVLDGERLLTVPRARVRRAELWPWDPQEGKLLGWGGAGTISTLSHGVLLLATAPLWLLTTAVVTINESTASELIYPHDRWEDLVKWARFPQGLPPGVAAAALIHQDRTPAPALPPEPVPPPAPAVGSGAARPAP